MYSRNAHYNSCVYFFLQLPISIEQLKSHKGLMPGLMHDHVSFSCYKFTFHFPCAGKKTLYVHPESTGQCRGEEKFAVNEERRVKDLVVSFHKVSGRLPASLLVSVNCEQCHGSPKSSCSGVSYQSSFGLAGLHDLLLHSVMAEELQKGNELLMPSFLSENFLYQSS